MLSPGLWLGLNGEHNHDTLSELEIELNKFKIAIKERTLSVDVLCSEIYKQERKKLSEKTGSETCSIWHADGTFYTAAKYFYQLYVINVWFFC